MRWVNQRCFATAAPRAVSVANPQLFFSVAFWYQKLYLYYVNGNDYRHVLNFGKWRPFRNLFCVLKLYSIECHWWFQATQSNYFFIITLCIETYRKGAATILQSYDSAKKKKKFPVLLLMSLPLNSNKQSAEELVIRRSKVSVLDVRPVTGCWSLVVPCVYHQFRMLSLLGMLNV